MSLPHLIAHAVAVLWQDLEEWTASHWIVPKTYPL